MSGGFRVKVLDVFFFFFRVDVFGVIMEVIFKNICEIKGCFYERESFFG